MFKPWLKVLSLSWLGVGLLLEPCWSDSDPICQHLIPLIAKEVGVPPRLLQALSKVESQGCPYAVNEGGKRLSFKTAQEAWVYIKGQFQQGNVNLDIGCMQINWKSHEQAVGNARLLLVPEHNIRYAVQFLKSLYQELGSWSKAVATYHSRTKHKGQGYVVKIAQALKNDQIPISLERREQSS